jgi:hypothetical protein
MTGSLKWLIVNVGYYPDQSMTLTLKDEWPNGDEGEHMGEKSDILWNQELVHEVLGVSDWRFKEFFEVFTALLVLVACFVSLSDGFTMEDHDVPVEGVEKKDDIRFDRDAVM